MMRKIYVSIVLFLILIIVITIVGSSIVDGDTPIDDEKDILVMQANKETYFNVYGYDINNPNVIINPYGNSPLTAIVMFTSSNYSEVEITVKSKNGNSDISYMFDKDKYHIIPIYGLYPDYDNIVIIRCEGIEKIINIKTEKLPDDFKFVDEMYLDNFMYYNVNYPYVVDINGEVRWYLNSNYYGNITVLDNSSFIIGSDRYNEEGTSISLYKMNFLGKIYNEYIVNEYYGINTLYQDNMLILSDNLLHIDIQTGKIIYNYGNNDGYNYLDIYDDNIVIRKENIFYILNDNALEEVNYNKEITNILFYNNTSNYRVVTSNRFGDLKETEKSKKNISLIKYNNLDKLDNIGIVKEVDRIKIINNNKDNIYVILDKFMDKRIYEVDNIKYINMYNLDGKYTIYIKINNKVYKTDYYVEVTNG